MNVMKMPTPTVKVTRSVIAIVALAVATGCGSQPPVTTREQAPIPVSVGRVTAEDLAVPFEAGGILRPLATAAIASRIMAPIAAIHVTVGDRVSRGSRLITLDAREMAAASTRARASLASASETIRAAEADVRAAESNVTLARATYDRVSALHAKRSATPQELDQAVAGVKAADAQFAAAQARVTAANASRDAAAAASEGARVAATYGILVAPFDALVTSRSADPGSMAMPGATLLTLEDSSKWRLELQIDEARAAFVSIGQHVDVHLDRANDEGWIAGRIVELARLDPISHNYLAKAELPPSPTYRSGTFGRARIPGERRRTLTAPSRSIVRRGQLTFVFVVADSVARLRPVRIGSTPGERVEVLAGLSDGDVVALNPPPALTDGARIVGTSAAREAIR